MDSLTLRDLKLTTFLLTETRDEKTKRIEVAKLNKRSLVKPVNQPRDNARNDAAKLREQCKWIEQNEDNELNEDETNNNKLNKDKQNKMKQRTNKDEWWTTHNNTTNNNKDEWTTTQQQTMNEQQHN